MLRFIVIVVLVAVCLSGTGFAQSRGLGLGIIFGEHTGLSLKKWSGSTTAIDGGVSWSFGDRDALHLHIDYLVHSFSLFPVERGALPFYYGIGGRIKFEEKGNTADDNEVGVRVPLGLNYIFAQPSIDLFFEVVPVFDFAPSTDFGISGGVGIRYFFE